MCRSMYASERTLLRIRSLASRNVSVASHPAAREASEKSFAPARPSASSDRAGVESSCGFETTLFDAAQNRPTPITAAARIIGLNRPRRRNRSIGERKCKNGEPQLDRDIFLPVHFVDERRPPGPGEAGGETPQLLAGLAVDGMEGARRFAEEDKISGGRGGPVSRAQARIDPSPPHELSGIHVPCRRAQAAGRAPWRSFRDVSSVRVIGVADSPSGRSRFERAVLAYFA